MKSKLLTSVTLANGIELSNRFVLSPMTTNSSTKDGHITKEDLFYAKRRANSAPLQVTGAAYINREGQLFEYGFSVDTDECIAGLSEMAKTMKSEGARAILQLTHAGRFANHYVVTNKRAVGPSEMNLNSPVVHKVHALTISEIEKIKNDYVRATRRAIKAGFDGIEISSAQRLLLQTFFSTFSNERHDEYGCDSLESRSRFILEVFSAVAEVIKNEAPKDFILGYRATPEETRGEEIGYTIEEFNTLTDWILETAPISYLAIASWGENIYLNRVRAAGVHQGRLVNEVVYEHLAGRIPLIASGGINSIQKCEEALRWADMVGLSSVLVAEPDFITKFASGHANEINLNVSIDDIKRLAIPEAAFKDIVLMMDYGKSLPEHTRDEFRKLEKNY